jgi:hypothetical protein
MAARIAAVPEEIVSDSNLLNSRQLAPLSADGGFHVIAGGNASPRRRRMDGQSYQDCVIDFPIRRQRHRLKDTNDLGHHRRRQPV